MNVAGFLAVDMDYLDRFSVILFLGLRLDVHFVLRKTEFEMCASEVLDYLFLNHLSLCDAVYWKFLLVLWCVVDVLAAQLDVWLVGLLMHVVIRGRDVSVSHWILSFERGLIITQHQIWLSYLIFVYSPTLRLQRHMFPIINFGICGGKIGQTIPELNIVLPKVTGFDPISCRILLIKVILIVGVIAFIFVIAKDDIIDA